MKYDIRCIYIGLLRKKSISSLMYKIERLNKIFGTHKKRNDAIYILSRYRTDNDRQTKT